MAPSSACSPHAEHVVDRPDVEAPRGVELTGTNGRKAITQTPLRGFDESLPRETIDGKEHCVTCGQTQVMELASTIRFPDHHKTGRNGSFPFPDRELKICGGHGPGETPGPIPNPEAKAWHGDGTALDRVWESSTPPHHT